MRLTATLTGDLRRLLAEEVRAGERAAMAAIRAETEQVKQELRQQVMAAFGGDARGVANAWRGRVFPTSGESLRPAGLVFTRLPKVIDAFERGALIRPKGGGKFLAIPTSFNRQGGRRGAKARVSPAQMVASRQGFLRPLKSGRGFVWCLPVRQGQRTGRGRAPLIAGGLMAVATSRRKGAAAWQQALLAQGFVPMFLLLPQVRLAKRLDVQGAAERALRRLPRRFVAAWERESGRAAA
ncbi:DUF6441 family protein [Rubritepida flocculans]|uniref:DUF6441 family protein n=1 Tax=Rubritepida flocculans TaxID=182403 RepID=UPI00042787CA|nr:DUF6441 family protein [Rubritepida flocculans]